MNSAHLRPIEDAIGQPMLQIAKAGGVFQIAIRGIIRPTLILRIVHHQFQAYIASSRGEDRRGLKQAVYHGVSKVGPLDVAHGGMSGSWIQKVALDHFNALLTELIGPRIELMDQGANREALFQ
jgi:hypothetical protein